MQNKLWAGIVCLFFFFLSSTGYAVNDNANCGPGKAMATSENAVVTVNISSSLTYAAATTSSTSGCEGPFADSGRVSARFTQIYLAHNYEKISEEIAQGQGKYLETLAGMMGCSEEAQPLFSQVTQQVYSELFNTTPSNHQEKFLESREVMKKMKHYIALDRQLSQMCITS